MQNLATTATLVLSLPDGMTHQEAFSIINKTVNPFGIDFIYPAYPGIDKPVVVIRVLKNENVG